MPISKRLRYEILRRDNHTCRYCGASAPEVKLTVDHVIPSALGGSDDASNLTAACPACNAGKSSSSPDSPLVTDVTDDALRWANAMQRAADDRRAERETRKEDSRWFAELWDRWHVGGDHTQRVPRDPNWESSLARWLDGGLDHDEIADLIRVAMEAKVSASETWRYFCGCCWHAVTDLQRRASQILDAEVLPHAANPAVEARYKSGVLAGAQLGRALHTSLGWNFAQFSEWMDDEREIPDDMQDAVGEALYRISHEGERGHGS